MAGASVALVPAIEMTGSWRARLLLRPTVAQLGRYALVGGVGTLLNVLLFLVARLWWDAVPANLVAIVLTTLATTEANRRFTFRGERRRWRTLLQNVGTVAFYAFYGSAVLMLLDTLVAHPTQLMESIAVAAAGLVGGIARFAVMRLWAFAPTHAARRRLNAAGHPAGWPPATASEKDPSPRAGVRRT